MLWSTDTELHVYSFEKCERYCCWAHEKIHRDTSRRCHLPGYWIAGYLDGNRTRRRKQSWFRSHGANYGRRHHSVNVCVESHEIWKCASTSGYFAVSHASRRWCPRSICLLCLLNPPFSTIITNVRFLPPRAICTGANVSNEINDNDWNVRRKRCYISYVSYCT